MELDQKWKNVLEFSKDNEKNSIIRSYSKEWNQPGTRSYLAECNYIIGIDFFRKKAFHEFKQKIYNSAMIYEYCFNIYNNYWISYNMKPYTYALLSDNKNLVNRFSNISLADSGQNTAAFYNYSIQGLLRDDPEMINKSLKIIDKGISSRKEVSIKRAHKMCIEGIVNKDKVQILKGIHEFELKRNKKRFIANDICENFISFFPVIYAKIAWMKDMKIDPGSKFVPFDLLKIEPLNEYTIPYWFLRDFYREQGIDWRYDPIYPELQDWENDPENPYRKKGGFFGKLFS